MKYVKVMNDEAKSVSLPVSSNNLMKLEVIARYFPGLENFALTFMQDGEPCGLDLEDGAFKIPADVYECQLRSCKTEKKPNFSTKNEKRRFNSIMSLIKSKGDDDDQDDDEDDEEFYRERVKKGRFEKPKVRVSNLHFCIYRASFL